MISNARKYKVEVTISNAPVTEYYHTDGNVYIEGRKGSKYKLRISNNTNKSVLAVASVDGLSVMNGNPAGLDSPGYVVAANSSIDIEGWVVDNDTQAAFEFADMRKSYGAQSGSNQNAGVIGVMFFEQSSKAAEVDKILKDLEEQVKRYPQFPDSTWPNPRWPDHVGDFPPYRRPDIMWDGPMFSQTTSSHTERRITDTTQLVNNVGTAFGEKIDSSIKEIEFERKDSTEPDEILCLYYDDERGLRQRGIHVKKINEMPSAFPKYQQTKVGCTPPKNWS